jgi:hypothetical protein
LRATGSWFFFWSTNRDTLRTILDFEEQKPAGWRRPSLASSVHFRGLKWLKWPTEDFDQSLVSESELPTRDVFFESIFPQTKSLPFKKSLQTEYHKNFLKGRPRTPTKINLSLSFFEIQRNFSQTIQAWAYTETPPSFIWSILFLYFGHKNFAFLPDILEGDNLPPTKKTCSWGRCSYNVRPPSDVSWFRFAPVTSSL